jgi:hypothetical protein
MLKSGMLLAKAMLYFLGSAGLPLRVKMNRPEKNQLGPLSKRLLNMSRFAVFFLVLYPLGMPGSLV